MIAIVNVGPHDDPDPTGWRNYEVRINHEVGCLRMAAAVVDRRMGELVAQFNREEVGQ